MSISSRSGILNTSPLGIAAALGYFSRRFISAKANGETVYHLLWDAVDTRLLMASQRFPLSSFCLHRLMSGQPPPYCAIVGSWSRCRGRGTSSFLRRYKPHGKYPKVFAAEVVLSVIFYSQLSAVSIPERSQEAAPSTDERIQYLGVLCSYLTLFLTNPKKDSSAGVIGEPVAASNGSRDSNGRGPFGALPKELSSEIN
ncbi:hypothetical protein RJZ90_000639 [Blastomyces dermatitidis]